MILIFTIVLICYLNFNLFKVRLWYGEHLYLEKLQVTKLCNWNYPNLSPKLATLLNQKRCYWQPRSQGLSSYEVVLLVNSISDTSLWVETSDVPVTVDNMESVSTAATSESLPCTAVPAWKQISLTKQTWRSNLQLNQIFFPLLKLTQ